MPRKRADLAWYSAESRKQGLPTPRCPLAHAELCPRYYESLDALGRGSGFTKIPSERSGSLEQKWKVFKSVIAEEEPYINGRGEGLLTVNHFCPEVSYDAYGYFASDMFEYADDIDRGYAEKAYEREGNAEQFDPRWESITPCHYTECREYSIHSTFAGAKSCKTGRRRDGVSPKRRWQVLARDSFTCTYCGRKPPDVELHVDHKVSVNDGGSDELDNLLTACDKCNLGKSDSSL
jgi:5-methylcytosine-specific restriction endonuclease McrA